MNTCKEKTHKLIASLKQSFQDCATKIEKLGPEKHKKILRIIAVIGLTNLAYSIFSIYTLVSFGLMAAGISLYLKLNIKEIKKKGLLAYLPAKHQKALLSRSIFDILCDIWFLPRISIYIKALISPFFLKLDPTEAIHQFKEFSPSTREAIFTKGIVNIMPNLIQSIMLPQAELANEEASDISSMSEEEQRVAAEELEMAKPLESKGQEDLIIDNNDGGSNKSTSIPLDSPTFSKNISHNGGGLFTSTDEECLVNHNFTLSKQLEVKKTLPSFADVSPLKTHLDYINSRDFHNRKNQNHLVRGPRTKERKVGTKVPKVKKMYDSENDIKSEVLNSDKLMRQKSKSRVVISETWDKLEVFAKLHKEKLLKQKLNPHGADKQLQFKGPLEKLQKIAMLMSKDALMNKLEEKKLIKLFLLSTLALLIQFSISKKIRTRYWCYNTLTIIMYISGFTLSTGSVAILMIKLKKRYEQWKSQQNKAIAPEDADHKDGDE